MAAAASSSNNISNNPRKILIVDDEPDITSSFDMILQIVVDLKLTHTTIPYWRYLISSQIRIV